MKCQKCGKLDATIHLTEVINGVKTESYLCKYCGSESNPLSSPFNTDFESFFQSFWGAPQNSLYTPQAPVQCSGCGKTIKEIQQSGRLGCSECYRTFRDYLQKPLKEIHGSNTHCGKTPVRIQKNQEKVSEVTALKAELDQAVLDQNFEKAAKLRDQIREIENKGKAV